jgi:serine O-acetyltransferase
VLAPHGGLTIGAGTTIGANSVLLESTGPDEVWVGVPAKRVR